MTLPLTWRQKAQQAQCGVWTASELMIPNWSISSFISLRSLLLLPTPWLQWLWLGLRGNILHRRLTGDVVMFLFFYPLFRGIVGSIQGFETSALWPNVGFLVHSSGCDGLFLLNVHDSTVNELLLWTDGIQQWLKGSQEGTSTWSTLNIWVVAFLFPLLGTSVGSCIAHCPVWHIIIVTKVLGSSLGMKKKSTGIVKVLLYCKDWGSIKYILYTFWRRYFNDK